MAAVCRLCASEDLDLLVDLGHMPIAHRVLTRPDPDEETFPLALHRCRSCGLVQILDPIDPEILYSGFNYNFSSWKPEPHLDDELDLIMSEVSPASAIEIGCNDGLFLSKLQERGVATVVGIEPNPVPAEVAEGRNLRVFNAMISHHVCDEIIEEFGQFDIVYSRQVLEHVHDIDVFFTCVDRLLKKDGKVFIDVPDFADSLQSGDCSLIWEEHVSYFDKAVLHQAMFKFGFVPLTSRYYDFSGGTIAVLAERGTAGEETPKAPQNTPEVTHHYAKAMKAYTDRLKALLSEAQNDGYTIVLYGTGCRACTVVNGLGIGNLIKFAVDDQIERQGKFMPGSHLEIKPSDELLDGQGKTICLLAVNNENEDKVSQKVTDMLGDHATIASLLGPKDIHKELEKIEFGLREYS